MCIDVADMARGAGGRMSTTRWGPDSIKANTGAQYVSCYSPEATSLLETVCTADQCPIDRIDAPLKRSTHFVLQPEASYTHWLPRGGTNTVVKQFLLAGQPDQLEFESRLERLTLSQGNKLYPVFDRGGALASCYDAIVLAMPPKDILRFFSHSSVSTPDPQSQADLHRRTNRGRSSSLPRGHQQISLPAETVRRLHTPSYNGRYSLALWLQEGNEFIGALQAGWESHQGPHPVIDMISSQEGVLVAQSTVDLWKRVEGGGRGRSGKGGKHAKGKGKGKGVATDSLGRIQGGGRDAARGHITASLEELAGCKIPRSQHAKLLNWRTSQACPPLPQGQPAITAEDGRLIFTGDWCVESSFEGCNLAAQIAAAAVVEAISTMSASADLHSTCGISDHHMQPEGTVTQPQPKRSRNRTRT